MQEPSYGSNCYILKCNTLINHIFLSSQVSLSYCFSPSLYSHIISFVLVFCKWRGLQCNAIWGNICTLAFCPTAQNLWKTLFAWNIIILLRKVQINHLLPKLNKCVEGFMTKRSSYQINKKNKLHIFYKNIML